MTLVEKIEREADRILNTTYAGARFNCNLRDHGWKFEWSKRTSSLGHCSYGKRTIYVSRVLLEQNPEKEDEWIDTVRHEAAHALCGEIYNEGGHGRKWKMCCVLTGARPERLATVPMEHKARWKVTCPNCKTTVYRDRVRKDAACAPCCKKYNKGRWSREFVMTKERNK